MTPLAFTSTIDAAQDQRVTAEDLGLLQVSGQPNLIVNELRSTADDGRDVWAAVVSVDPSSFSYEFAGDETVHVLEGSATVVINDDLAVELKPGVIASFRRGTTSRWTVHERLREFAVLS